MTGRVDAGSKDVDLAGKLQLVVGQGYLISRPNGSPREGKILEVKTNQDAAYVTFVGQDKRLDAWVPRHDFLSRVVENEPVDDHGVTTEANPRGTKRARGSQVPIEVQRLSGYNGSPRAVTKDLPHSHGHGFADSTASQASTPEREHANMTRVRNFEDVRFGEYLIRTWYYSPYPLPNEDANTNSHVHETPTNPRKRQRTSASPAVVAVEGSKLGAGRSVPASAPGSNLRKATDMFAKGVEGSRGRLWVCDLCFKYMKERAAWERHTKDCTQLQPPGRRVYQRGSYTIWEIDGAESRLYCQNLSLFGKLFIDHKTVFFHVENFKYYVLCDAASSKRDQVLGFFSKEKLSYDDYNLACIVTFPPFQNRGFGKLLMEFSYYLTLHPSTRPASLSPGTPERPLSDLGLKGYTAYWIGKVLRLLKQLLEPEPNQATPVKADQRARRSAQASLDVLDEDEVGLVINGVAFRKAVQGSHHTLSPTLGDIAKACHLRLDDCSFALEELGLLQYARPRTGPLPDAKILPDDSLESSDEAVLDKDGQWKGLEVVVSREMVLEACDKWRVKPSGVLDEKYVLL